MRSLPRTLALTIGCLSALSAQEAKPKLDLRTTTGQTTFHIGERIPLTLTLTGPDNKKYSIDTASYDRSGRLDIDTFAVTPATGWADPLAQYFSNGLFMGGGLRGSEPLSTKPVSFAADLNEHIRFDQPGDYTITATSHRVGTADKSGLPRKPHLSIQSNFLLIHIVAATAEWQAERLRSILAILATPIEQKPRPQLTDGQAAAIADLRFLNSPASIEALTPYLREDSDNHIMWSAALGLSGVPDSLRDTALHAMSRQLDDPSFPVSNFFLEIMAKLQGPEEDSSAPFKFQVYPPGYKAVWEQALSGLPRKQGSALAATANTLLTSAPDGEIPELKSRIAAAVANSFAALPIDSQIFALEYHWDVLSEQPILPTFQNLLHQPPAKSSPFHSAADVDSLVLRRWYDLDPEGAMRELTVLLASPDPQLDPRTLQLLPGGPQPQFEAIWARQLAESDDESRETLLAALLSRFGTGSATAQVEGLLDARVGDWACQPQAAALAYVLKFNSPNSAGLVHRAVASRQNTACYGTVFTYAAVYGHGHALNEEAITALTDSDAAVAADAAEYLRYFGTDAAKQPLLDRYQQWTAQWAVKPKELEVATDSTPELGMLGTNLGEALIANQGWLSDPKLITEVLSRCIGEQMCWELKNLASLATSSPQVSLNAPAPYDGYRIGQYSCKSMELFEAKLAQFPTGTRFKLVRQFPQTGNQLKLEQEAQALFKNHGFTLEPAPAAPNNPIASSAKLP